MDEYLTVAEIAERLKLNPQTVRNWVDRGELPAVRVGTRRVRIREVDLEAFIEASSNRAGEEVDEASIVAWATFGAAMAQATAALENTDRVDLVRVLETLATATRALVDQLAVDDPGQAA